MAAPVVPVAPQLPPAPTGVPAWLTRLFGTALILAGPAIDYLDPNGKIKTPAVEAAIIIAFLVIGSAFLLVHLVHSDVHEYGWSMKAADAFVSQEEAEIKTVWPQLTAQWSQVQPLLALLPGVNSKIGDFEAGLSGVQERLDSVPAADRTAVEAVVKEILAGTPIGPLAFPPAPAPETPVVQIIPDPVEPPAAV